MIDIFKFYSEFNNDDLLELCHNSGKKCEKWIACYVLYHRGNIVEEPLKIVQSVLNYCKKLTYQSRQELLVEELVLSFDNISKKDLVKKARKLSLESLGKVYSAFVLRNEELANSLFSIIMRRIGPSDLSRSEFILPYLYSLILYNPSLYREVRDFYLGLIEVSEPEKFYHFTNNNYFLPLLTDKFLNDVLYEGVSLDDILNWLEQLIRENHDYEWVKVSFIVKYIPFASKNEYPWMLKYLLKKIDLLPYPINKTYGTSVFFASINKEETAIREMKNRMEVFRKYSYGNSIISRNFNRSYNFIFDKFFEKGFRKACLYISAIAKKNDPFSEYSLVNSIDNGEYLIDFFGYNLSVGDPVKTYVTVFSKKEGIIIRKVEYGNLMNDIENWWQNGFLSHDNFENLIKTAENLRKIIFQNIEEQDYMFYLSIPPEMYWIPSSIIAYGKKHVISAKMERSENFILPDSPTVVVLVALNINKFAFANKEKLIISSIFDGNVEIFSGISRRKFLEKIKNADIVHILAHAEASDIDKIPLNSKSYLALSDLINFKFDKNPLIFINRCLGSQAPLVTDNVFMKGFPFYFLEAGASYVLASPVYIRDDIAFNFAKEFYLGLKHGEKLIDLFRRISLKYPFYSLISH